MSATNYPFQYSLRQLAALFVAVAVIMTWYVFPAGSAPRKTGRELDLAIFGKGWFQLTDVDGRILYTRSGDLDINRNGELTAAADKDSLTVEPSIIVPQEWSAIHVGPVGQVTAAIDNSSSQELLGNLQLARFVNPDGLNEVVPGVFEATEDSGIPLVGAPGQYGLGLVKQGWLEKFETRFWLEPSELITIAALCISVWTLLAVRELRKRIHEIDSCRLESTS